MGWREVVGMIDGSGSGTTIRDLFTACVTTNADPTGLARAIYDIAFEDGRRYEMDRAMATMVTAFEGVFDDPVREIEIEESQS
jgi:hypothetical protein